MKRRNNAHNNHTTTKPCVMNITTTTTKTREIKKLCIGNEDCCHVHSPHLMRKIIG